MSLCELSRTLSSELENLFAQLGDSNLPEEAHRLLSQQEESAAVDMSTTHHADKTREHRRQLTPIRR